MGSYLLFSSADGDVLVETEAQDLAEPLSETGEQLAGLGLKRWARNRAGEVIAVAQTGFDEAVRKAVSLNVPAFVGAAEALERPPAEMEITFGLKATGEVGNVAVGKMAGECSYQIKMVWKPQLGSK